MPRVRNVRTHNTYYKKTGTKYYRHSNGRTYARSTFKLKGTGARSKLAVSGFAGPTAYNRAMNQGLKSFKGRVPQGTRMTATTDFRRVRMDYPVTSGGLRPYNARSASKKPLTTKQRQQRRNAARSRRR
jgi:hypothetical protein